MSDFEAVEPSSRLVATHYGDDLQTVAAREMGDANRWVELVWLNQLVPPYITDDPRRVAAGVIQSGQTIKVPAPVGTYINGDTGRTFERDAALKSKRLMVSDSGDIAVAAGVDNLSQQLTHRVVTPRGQAARHPDYGCMIWRLLGRANGATAGLLGTQYVRSAIEADYRVSAVRSVKAEVSFDSVKISAQAEAIQGGYIDLEVDTSANIP